MLEIATPARGISRRFAAVLRPPLFGRHRLLARFGAWCPAPYLPTLAFQIILVPFFPIPLFRGQRLFPWVGFREFTPVGGVLLRPFAPLPRLLLGGFRRFALRCGRFLFAAFRCRYFLFAAFRYGCFLFAALGGRHRLVFARGRRRSFLLRLRRRNSLILRGSRGCGFLAGGGDRHLLDRLGRRRHVGCRRFPTDRRSCLTDRSSRFRRCGCLGRSA